jgi:hypothetical protein
MVRLESEIAIAAGVDAAEAKNVLSHLVNEFFLKLCATPARNVGEGGARSGLTRAWFEKGQLGKDS